MNLLSTRGKGRGKRIRGSKRYLWLMVKSKPKTTEEVLGKLEPEQTAIARRLRVIVKTAVPEASETVRRGVMTYVLGNKDFAVIHFYKDHVDLGLLEGAKLDDAHLKGSGKGKNVRHMKISSARSIDDGEIARLLKEAASLM
jgi:hypothetical protein